MLPKKLAFSLFLGLAFAIVSCDGANFKGAEHKKASASHGNGGKSGDATDGNSADGKSGDSASGNGQNGGAGKNGDGVAGNGDNGSNAGGNGDGSGDKTAGNGDGNDSKAKGELDENGNPKGKNGSTSGNNGWDSKGSLSQEKVAGALDVDGAVLAGNNGKMCKKMERKKFTDGVGIKINSKNHGTDSAGQCNTSCHWGGFPMGCATRDCGSAVDDSICRQCIYEKDVEVEYPC